MELMMLDKRVARLAEELKRLSECRSTPITDIQIRKRGAKQWQPFENGSQWARQAMWYDFRVQVSVPQAHAGQMLYLKLATGREGNWNALNPQFLAWVNGQIAQAFDTNHTTLLLSPAAQPGQTYDIELNAYAKHDERTPIFLYLDLISVDNPTLQLYYDLQVPLEAAQLLPSGSRERLLTLQTLSDACNLLDLRAPHSDAYAHSVQQAAAYLEEHFYQPLAEQPVQSVASCVGHTHIDVAWLWDLYQTRHKAARSFATVLQLMDQYPEYKFMSSQPALYQFVKQDQPQLYERIKERIAQGRWEAEGGMWVEADTNVTGGESLVRQFLHGKEYFRKEFGVDNRILWLPDVFGYSAALPQICKKSGIDYFMTSKISWNDVNMLPYDTFMWEGIDGTQILTHFTPATDLIKTAAWQTSHFTTYNAHITPMQIAGGWQRYQQKWLDNDFLVSYGYGDGGGGPTADMLEYQRRMHKNLPGMPKTQQQHTLPFFEGLQERVGNDPRLPKWVGELYLEFHRGTYTAIARNKRNNRKSELALRECELWCARAAAAGGFEYPAQQLHALWEDVLTLQFHDILPGSSIKKVYEDSDVMYEQVLQRAAYWTEQATQALLTPAQDTITAFNSLGRQRDDIIWFDAPADVLCLLDDQGHAYPVQRARGRCCAFVRGIPALGAKVLRFGRQAVHAPAVQADAQGFDTPYFTGMFDSAMRISSLVEKTTGRQLCRPGEPLNRIVCYENKPHAHDAWEINIYYTQHSFEVDALTGVQLLESGPVLSILRATYTFGISTIEQDIILYNDLPRVDFDTRVDWREKQYMLKALFPMDVHCNTATYDIQFGNIERPTHTNTSWDIARFEVCAHKWAGLSEPGFGAAVLNDCKYGYSARGNTLALTLLKSSTYPDEDGDQEEHRFVYALMPHVGSWREAGVADQAYALNIPLLCAQGGAEDLPALFSVDAPNVVIETVKQQLDGKATVLRVYENHGMRADHVRCLTSLPFVRAEQCNLMEIAHGDVPLCEGAFTFSIKPYEIKTFLLYSGEM